MTLQSAPRQSWKEQSYIKPTIAGPVISVNGQGTDFGPALDGVATRRTREWIEAHFRDPAKMTPGSPMPAFNFSKRDMDRITNYLMALPNR